MQADSEGVYPGSQANPNVGFETLLVKHKLPDIVSLGEQVKTAAALDFLRKLLAENSEDIKGPAIISIVENIKNSAKIIFVLNVFCILF